MIGLAITYIGSKGIMNAAVISEPFIRYEVRSGNESFNNFHIAIVNIDGTFNDISLNKIQNVLGVADMEKYFTKV